MIIKIYGLGAIGSNLLLQLIKKYPDFTFYGIDFDKVEERNIKTQAYFLEHVGHSKALALKAVLTRFVRKPDYKGEIRKVTSSETYIESDTLVIDCFDNTESRRLLNPLGINMKDLPVIHLGFSPLYTAEFIWNKDYEVPNDVDPRIADICSMTDAVPFIHMFVNLAVMEISRWIETKEKRSFILTNKTKLNFL